MMNDSTRTRSKVIHTSETWQAQRLAVRRSFLTHTRAATCHTKRDGTFLLSLDREWDFSYSSGSFFLFSFVAFFLSYPAFERPYPFCGFSLTAAQQLVLVYSCTTREHMNISALYARALTLCVSSGRIIAHGGIWCTRLHPTL
jgi:hypothetical protein